MSRRPLLAFFLELGLDTTVGTYPYFVLSFIAILLATVVGGALGGLVAAVSSWLLNTFVLAARIPAEDIRPILDGINAGLAFVIGLSILEMRRRPILAPVDELTAVVDRPTPQTADHRARILTAAIDDLAASRSTAQIADVLARRLQETTGAGWVAVFVRPRVDVAPALRATAGVAPPGLPDRLEPAADPGTLGLIRADSRPIDEGKLTIPIVVGTEVVGAAQLGPAPARAGGNGNGALAGSADELEPTLSLDSGTGATAVALTRLAASALERDRLIASGRAATTPHPTRPDASRALSRLAAQLGGALTVDAVGQLLVDHAVSALGAEFGLASRSTTAARRSRSSMPAATPLGSPSARRPSRPTSTAPSAAPRGPAARSRSARPRPGGASSRRSPTSRR